MPSDDRPWTPPGSGERVPHAPPPIPIPPRPTPRPEAPPAASPPPAGPPPSGPPPAGPPPSGPPPAGLPPSQPPGAWPEVGHWTPGTPPPIAGAPAGVDVGGPPKRTSVKTIALSAVGVVLSLLWILVLTAAPAPPSPGAEQADSPVFLILVGVGLFIRSIAEPLVWWSKTYSVGDRSMVIDSGVFARHRREIPFDRIQQVDLRQPFIARAFGLTVMRVDTAGEGGGEPAHLQYLEYRDAEALRLHLLRRRDEMARVALERAGGATPGYAGGPLPPPPERELLEVPTGLLVLAGLTEEYVLLGAASVVACLVWLVGGVATGSDVLGWIAGAGTVALLGTIAVAAFSAIGTTVHYGGFTLVARGDDLSLGYGLIERRELAVPRRRIQRVTVLDNPVRRLLGFTTLQLRTAAAPGVAAGGQSTTFVVPCVRRDELASIAEAVDGGRGWLTDELTRRPPAAARRAVVRRCGLALAVVIVPAVLTAPAGLALLAIPLVGIPLGRVAHARAGHAVTATSVVLSRGVVRHRTEAVPLDRVQSCRTVSSPFQRRRDLATLHVDVAGGAGPLASSPHLYDMGEETALALTRSLPRHRGGR